MKVTKERNPYLKRLASGQARQYSFDLDSGKHYLINQEGKQTPINKNGTYQPKWRPHFSGFIGHKQRYTQAVSDPSALHFAPDLQFVNQRSFHTPMPDKFAGYAQFPYKLRQQFPNYLRRPNSPALYKIQKSQSVQNSSQAKPKQAVKASLILQHSATKFIDSRQNQTFFNNSFMSMTETKPLPRHKKKTCYNYKCKYLKQFVFDPKGKTESMMLHSERNANNTLSRSFYQEGLKLEMQETKLISTMALTSCSD